MSDHFSGPRALAGPAGDICDFYAFPSPERPGHVALVMTVHPRATAETAFSDAIVHRFRARPLTVTADPAGFVFGVPELVVDTRFGPGGARQVGRCTVAGETVEVGVGDAKGSTVGDIRVFAGLRSDPFFLDLPAYLTSLKSGQLAFTGEGRNSLHGLDVLALVVELPAAALGDLGGPLVGMVAETVVAGPLPVRLERVGRPEIKNAVLSFTQFDRVNRTLEVRDLYNLEDPFHMSGDYSPVYRARLDANLAALDALDGRTDWALADDGGHPLAGLLLADHLVLDVSRPFAAESFLAIERDVLAGRPHLSCGGRPLHEHAMDALYTLLINGGTGPRISDNVPGPTRPAGDTFPYLAPPNLLPPAKGATP